MRKILTFATLVLVYLCSLAAQSHERGCFEECMHNSTNGTACYRSCTADIIAYSKAETH